MKSFYNFFKHANYDHDYEIDVTNISGSNDLHIVIAIADYRMLFSDDSFHMRLFTGFMAVMHPDMFDWPRMEVESTLAECRETLKGSTPDEIKLGIAELVTTSPFEEEAQADRRPLLTSAGAPRGIYGGPPHRDMFKRRAAAAAAEE